MPNADSDLLSDLLSPLRLTGVFSSRWFARAPWGINGDSEDIALIHYVHRGSCAVEMPDRADPVLLAEGAVAVFPHGTAHRLGDRPNRPGAPLTQLLPDRPAGDVRDVHVGGDGPETMLLCGGLRYDAWSMAPLYEDLPSILVLPPEVVRGEPLLVAALHQLVQRNVVTRPGERLVALRAFEMVFLLALRAALGNQLDDRRPLVALRQDGIAAALHLIHTRFGEHWTLAAFAEQAQMSRSGFAAAFSAAVGEPPMRHLANRRLQEAARLLATTRLSNTQIATRVGYLSAAGLHLAFSRQVGLPPGVFRRDALKQRYSFGEDLHRAGSVADDETSPRTGARAQ